MERLIATYRIETSMPVDQAAAVLAGEQSSGTFVPIPGETAALKERFAARVEEVLLLDRVAEPSLPGCRARSDRGFQRAEIKVSWPVENFGFNLPTLVSTVQGNLYELSQFSGLKLVDLELPEAFCRHFRGPQFGVEGTRELCQAANRPLIGTIIKPSIGLSPEETAGLVRTLAQAGIDFIKDDELMADPPHSPFVKRVEAVMRVIQEHAQQTGKQVMYAFNISGEMDEMRRNYDHIVASKGSCAMISLNSTGLAGAKKMADLGALAIHGHRNGWGMLNRHPFLGVEFQAYQKIWRLAGVDQIHVNGISNKFWESDDSVTQSIKACRQPIAGQRNVLPVVSSGQWGGQAPETYRRTRTVDLLYMAGGGIMAHPEGPAQGVRSLRLWWEAAVEGLDQSQAVLKYPALKISKEKFGGSA